MEINTLQTIQEILHYGSLGEIKVTTPEDWEYIDKLLNTGLQDSYDEGMSAGMLSCECDEEELDAHYERGYSDGYDNGVKATEEDC